MFFNILSAFAIAELRDELRFFFISDKNESQPVDATEHSEKYLSKSESDSHFLKSALQRFSSTKQALISDEHELCVFFVFILQSFDAIVVL